MMNIDDGSAHLQNGDQIARVADRSERMPRKQKQIH